MQDVSGFVHTVETTLASSDDLTPDSLLQSFKVDCDDLMPCQYEVVELIQVFQHMPETHCKWTQTSKADWSYVFSHYDMWVSRFKNRINQAQVKFELRAACCSTHVGGHPDQLWDCNKSYLSISLRVQDTLFK